VAYPLLDEVDRRLIGALQVDGRASPEQLADALELPPRTVTRLLAALLRDGTVRVSDPRRSPPVAPARAEQAGEGGSGRPRSFP